MSYTVPESIESGWSLSFTRIGLKSACWQAEIFGKYLQFRHGETWPLQREELISFNTKKLRLKLKKTNLSEIVVSGKKVERFGLFWKLRRVPAASRNLKNESRYPFRHWVAATYTLFETHVHVFLDSSPLNKCTHSSSSQPFGLLVVECLKKRFPAIFGTEARL